LPVNIGDESDDVSQEFVHGRLCFLGVAGPERLHPLHLRPHFQVSTLGHSACRTLAVYSRTSNLHTLVWAWGIGVMLKNEVDRSPSGAHTSETNVHYQPWLFTGLYLLLTSTIPSLQLQSVLRMGSRKGLRTLTRVIRGRTHLTSTHGASRVFASKGLATTRDFPLPAMLLPPRAVLPLLSRLDLEMMVHPRRAQPWRPSTLRRCLTHEPQATLGVFVGCWCLRSHARPS
jgi:hypothetical protein